MPPQTCVSIAAVLCLRIWSVVGLTTGSDGKKGYVGYTASKSHFSHMSDAREKTQSRLTHLF